MSTTFWIILGGAVATYLTRIGGYLVISRFKHLHPRVEAGLNAVPVAVLTTLFAPAVTEGGPVEWVAMAASAAVALRSNSFLLMFLAGAAVLVALRQFVG
ncbi:AzlD family protein [Chelativorans composti]|uniref:AzlD family protein n=1 Tax=Chelativorans composti TaxID=768533 RepID=A0ABW5DHF7_9HYPH|nr:AzlD family protein [bacterium SGD-2]